MEPLADVALLPGEERVIGECVRVSASVCVFVRVTYWFPSFFKIIIIIVLV